MAILTVGIDLAKNVFALHGVNEVGKPELLQPRVPRAKLHALVATLPPCIIGIEACFGAHRWARLFHAAGPAQSLVGVVVARCNCGVESIRSQFTTLTDWGVPVEWLGT